MNALIEEARRAENELRKLRKLADVVGDLATEPDCPPEIRDVWTDYRKAVAS